MIQKWLEILQHVFNTNRAPEMMLEGFKAIERAFKGYGMINLREGFLALHLMGLSLGFVSAIRADIRLLRATFGAPNKISDSYMIQVGFGLLWLSGLGFITQYYLYSPASLNNPKLWAKLFVVTVAAVNGIWIERRLLKGPVQRSKALLAVSISSVSWVAAFGLGIFRSLNFKVGFLPLLTVYLTAIAATLVVAVFVSLFFRVVMSFKKAT